MAYSRGQSSNIIVGAVALFFTETPMASSGINAPPSFLLSESYKDTLSSAPANTRFRNVGYTTNGLELQFQPDFSEVQIDQLLDSAKLYRSGMKITLSTAFAEATLENLVLALAYDADQLISTANTSTLDLYAGDIGECLVEKGIIAVGPGTGDCNYSKYVERVFMAYRALSIDNVTVSAKRDEATIFNVSFRLLPEDSGKYGKIVDRSWMQLNTENGYGEGEYGDGPYGL